MKLLLLLSLFAAGASAQAPADKETGKKSVQFILGLMNHKNPEIRSQAAGVWGEIGNKAAIPFLKKALKDSDPYVRIESAYSLHLLGDEGGFEALRAIVAVTTGTAPAKAPAKNVKVSTAAAIPNPLDEMREIARNKVRVAAIGRMADIGGVPTVEILERTIDDPSEAVRDASAVALARLGFDELDSVFIEAMSDPREAVRAATAKALGQIGRPVGIAELRAATLDASPSVRAEAVRALGNSPESGVVSVILDGLKDKDRMVKAAAVEAATKIQGPEGAKALYSVLKDTAVPVITLKVMAGLSERGDRVDLELVERALRQKDPDLLVEAVKVLRFTRDESAVKLLRSTLEEDFDPRVKLQAAAALVKRLQRAQDAP